MRKKILITGGAGFIGFNLVKSLYKKYKITIIDNFSRGKLDKSFKSFVEINNITIAKQDLKKKIKLKNNFDYIFHLAATVGVKNVTKDPIFTFKNNVDTLFKIIDFCKKNKKTKLIFFSTSEVYSPLIEKKIKNLFPLKENYIMQLKTKHIPRDSYYLSKLFSEAILQTSELNYTIYRPHNIFGPRMGMSHVIPELINKIYNKIEKNVLIQSPNHKRVFCYIDEAIQQIIKTFTKKSSNKEILNIGSNSNEISIWALANEIAKIKKNNKKLMRGKITPGSPSRRVTSTKKTKNISGKYPKISFKKALLKTYEWYQKK